MRSKTAQRLRSRSRNISRKPAAPPSRRTLHRRVRPYPAEHADAVASAAPLRVYAEIVAGGEVVGGDAVRRATGALGGSGKGTLAPCTPPFRELIRGGGRSKFVVGRGFARAVGFAHATMLFAVPPAKPQLISDPKDERSQGKGHDAQQLDIPRYVGRHAIGKIHRVRAYASELNGHDGEGGSA